MKAMMKAILTAGLVLMCGLTYADSLEGNVRGYAVWTADLDGAGPKNYIMFDIANQATPCSVPYVGYGVILMSLEVTGAALLKNQAAYSGIIAAQAAGFTVKSDYHIEHSSTYNIDLCYMDTVIVETPQ